MTRPSVRRTFIAAFETCVKRRRTFRYWRDLERTQWLDPSELARLQFDRLHALVAHAYESCPYYREAWQERGLSPADLRSPQDLVRWPVIDRDTVTAHRARMRARGLAGQLLPKSTGGSTGVPLHFDLDRDSHDRRNAATFRGYGWAGAGPGTRQFYLWGTPLGDRTPLRRVKEDLYNRLYNRQVVSSFGLSDRTAPAVLKRLERTRPEVLVGYTNSLYEFARWLRAAGRRPTPPRSLVVGAEKLHGFQRVLIEEVFGAPVFETYGSREFMLMAAECDRHDGLHLTTENHVVELLDDRGEPVPDGEEGDVVVTDLTNLGMPFVRYRNGDRAVRQVGDCPCGRGLGRLSAVSGRRLDVLHTPDGRRVPGEFFPHLLKDYPAVRRFQAVQHEPDRVELCVVLDGDTDGGLGRIRREVETVLGPCVRFDLRQVDDIPLTASGKHRVVVNTCPPAALAAAGRPV